MFAMEDKDNIIKLTGLDALFYACFGVYISNIEECIEMSRGSEDFRQIERLCIKYDIDNYAPYAYVYVKSFMSYVKNIIPLRSASKKEKELTDLLYSLTLPKETNVSVNINGQKLKIQDKKTIELIKKALMTEYKKRNYNRTYLSIQEADSELRKSRKKKVPKNNSLPLLRDYIAKNPRYCDSLDNSYFKDRRQSLYYTLKSRETHNDRIAQLCLCLNHLISFEDYKQSNELSAYDISRNATNLKFIYACLTQLNIIEVKYKTREDNEIRTYIKNYEDSDRYQLYPSEKESYRGRRMENLKDALNSSNTLHIDCLKNDVVALDLSMLKSE